MSSFIQSIPFVFALSLTLSVMFYLIGSAVSPKAEKEEGKGLPYACGEDYPAKKVQMRVGRLFLYVTYFMIFDISAFVLATSFGNQGLYPIVFITIILLSVITLLPVWGRREDGAD